MTTDQVEAIHREGLVSGDNVLVQAQNMVGLVCGRDLGDPDWIDHRGRQRPVRWLQNAVAYQAVAEASGQGAAAAAAAYVPGAQSISNGDVHITFRGTAGNELTGLTGLASTAIQRLSWMSGFRSVQAAPFSSVSSVRPGVRFLAPGQSTRWTTISVNLARVAVLMSIPLATTTVTLLAPSNPPVDAGDDWATAPDPETGYTPVATGIRAHFSASGQSSFGFGQYVSEGNIEQLRYELLADPCALAADMRVRDEATGLEYDVAWVTPKAALIPHVVASVTRSVGTP